MFPFFKMSPLNVEKKIESSKLFVIQNYWRDKQKKIIKSKNFIPPFLNKKTNGSLHHFLDGYHIQYPCRLRVNTCLIFNFAFLFHFSYRFWQWGSWRKMKNFAPFKSLCANFLSGLLFSFGSKSDLFCIPLNVFRFFLETINVMCF